MTDAASVRAVLFVKNPGTVASFYIEALDMQCSQQDTQHAVLQRSGFELIVHRIPDHIAAGIELSQPPVRRESGAIRLDYAVDSIERSRMLARQLGGDIDDDPPAWADRDSRFYLGCDPEGNVFGVSERAAP